MIELNQEIFINEERYLVVSITRLEEYKNEWIKYIISRDYDCKNLLVQRDENGKDQYFLCEDYKIDSKQMSIKYNDQELELYKFGTLKVVSTLGTISITVGDECEYEEYCSKDKKTKFFIEKWPEYTLEGTICKYIDEKDIKLGKVQYMADIQNQNTPNKVWVRFSLIVFSLILIIELFPKLESFINKDIFSRYLKNERKQYTYVTTISNKYNKSTAKVYKSKNNNLESNIKEFIKRNHRYIKRANDVIKNNSSNNNDNENNILGVGIQSDYQYAYFYYKDNSVFVQVSNNEFISDPYFSMYHEEEIKNYEKGFKGNLGINTKFCSEKEYN